MDEWDTIVRVAMPDGGCADILRALAAHGVGAADGSEPDALLVRAHRLAICRVMLPSRVPVVVIGGPSDSSARAALLDAGAADVVPADVDPIELAARLRALVRLRRLPPIACADLSVDLVDRRAERAGRMLPLHPREFALLGMLARHRDRAVDRPALLGAVWQRRFDPGTNVVAVTVSRLRHKVDRGFATPLIHTVGAAYMLSAKAVATG